MINFQPTNKSSKHSLLIINYRIERNWWYWVPSVMLAVVGIHAVMQQLWEWHSFLLMIRPGAEYQFIYLKYSLGSNNYKPSHLFIRPHYSLSSTPTWILGLLSGLGYTAHYWIWGQPIIGHNFLTIAKNCKNSAAPGQVYCSVAAGDTKSWNNKMISNKKLRVVCIFAGAQIWQV